MKKVLTVVMAVMVLVLCGCKSGDYKKAVDLYETGNYAEAKVLFEKVGDYEDSATYLRNIEVLLDPVGAIEAECGNVISNDIKFMSGYLTLLQKFGQVGLATSGGQKIYETRYDEQSKEFACLVDIPYMNGSKVYMHYYFGFAGHLDVPDVVITKVESIEFTESKVSSFWSKYWKH